MTVACIYVYTERLRQYAYVYIFMLGVKWYKKETKRGETIRKLLWFTLITYGLQRNAAPNSNKSRYEIVEHMNIEHGAFQSSRNASRYRYIAHSVLGACSTHELQNIYHMLYLILDECNYTSTISQCKTLKAIFFSNWWMWKIMITWA